MRSIVVDNSPDAVLFDRITDKLRPLKNLAIFTIPKKTMDFFGVTGSLRPGRN